METTRRKRPYVPEVIKEFPSLGGDKNEIKVRLVRYSHPYFGESEPRLDIRRHLTDHENADGEKYTGFTKQGFSLTWDDLQALMEILPQVIDKMDELARKEKGKK